MILHVQRKYHITHKAYLFDFDGTLADSMPFWSAKMLHLLDQLGVSYPEDIIRTISPLGDLGSALYFQQEFGVIASVEEMIREMDAYALPLYREQVDLKPGVREYLEYSRAAGIQLCVLTASPHKMVDPCLQRTGVAPLFDHIWTTEDFGLTKTQPEIYLQAAERLQLSVSDLVFFDDNLHALRTGKTAGVYTVGIYDASGEALTEEIRSLSDSYATNFQALPLL